MVYLSRDKNEILRRCIAAEQPKKINPSKFPKLSTFHYQTSDMDCDFPRHAGFKYLQEQKALEDRVENFSQKLKSYSKFEEDLNKLTSEIDVALTDVLKGYISNKAVQFSLMTVSLGLLYSYLINSSTLPFLTGGLILVGGASFVFDEWVKKRSAEKINRVETIVENIDSKLRNFFASIGYDCVYVELESDTIPEQFKDFINEGLLLWNETQEDKTKEVNPETIAIVSKLFGQVLKDRITNLLKLNLNQKGRLLVKALFHGKVDSEYWEPSASKALRVFSHIKNFFTSSNDFDAEEEVDVDRKSSLENINCLITNLSYCFTSFSSSEVEANREEIKRLLGFLSKIK